MAREGGIIQWQWQNYPENHENVANLLFHIVGVPIFILGMIAFIGNLAQLRITEAVIGLIIAIGGYALQILGHKLEAEPPIPFDGPVDAIQRIFTEQFITFPRFVISGGWLRALRQALH